MRRLGIVWISALAVIGCAMPPESSHPLGHIDIPAFPLPAGEAITIDLEELDAMACGECQNEQPSASRWITLTLPETAFAALNGSTDLDRRAKLRGDLWFGGYFGGVYLRSAFGEASIDVPAAVLGRLMGSVTADATAGFAAFGEAERAALAGRSGEVTGLWAALAAAIYGYNIGYLRVFLEHAPAGHEPLTIDCAQYFDCTVNGARGIEVPGTHHAGLEAIARLAEGQGSAVWDQIFASSDLDAAQFDLIVDASVGFLRASAAAALNLAGQSLGARQRGIDFMSALVVWAGSYFAGLAAPSSAFPQLACSM